MNRNIKLIDEFENENSKSEIVLKEQDININNNDIINKNNNNKDE